MTDISRVQEKLNQILSESPKEFKELALDLQDMSNMQNNPVYLALFIYHLSREREKTNQLLSSLGEKLEILTNSRDASFKTNQNASRSHEVQLASSITATTSNADELQLMSEQDQKILDLIERKGMLSSNDIKNELDYKGLNAASQRLNKLFREGFLKKVRAGRKTFFLMKNSLPPTHR